MSVIYAGARSMSEDTTKSTLDCNDRWITTRKSNRFITAKVTTRPITFHNVDTSGTEIEDSSWITQAKTGQSK